MDLNPSRICSPLKSLGYSMIIVVLGIIGVSYDAVAVLTLGPHLLDGGAMTLLSVVLLTLFQALLVLLSWSYFMVLLNDPGSVPANRKMSPQQNVEDGNSVIFSISVVIPNSATMTSSQGLKENQQATVIDAKMASRGAAIIALFANDAFLRWIIIAFGLSIVPGLKNTISFFFLWSKASFELTWETGCHFLGFCLLCFVIMHASLMIINTTSVEDLRSMRSKKVYGGNTTRDGGKT